MASAVPIYLDYNATTPVDEAVLSAMEPYWRQDFANPASNHLLGWSAKKAVDEAREQIASLINAEDPQCIMFTAGATESNNLALKGFCRPYALKLRDQSCGLLTQNTEHTSVLEPLRDLEAEGFELTVLECDESGKIEVEKFKSSLKSTTILASVMAANNEIGTIQPLKELGRICQERGVRLHSDAVQAAGKIAIDVQQSYVDLLTLSAHKMYGPKGIGALYISSKRPRARLLPLISGGGHERGLRSGTLAVPLIVGFGKACELAQRRLAADSSHCLTLKQKLWHGLREGLGQAVSVNGSWKDGLPNTLNVAFAGVEGESLLMSLPQLAVSSGSACESAQHKVSHVLLALGLDEIQVRSSLRFCIGRPTTADEIDDTVRLVVEKVSQLRKLSIANQNLHAVSG